MTTILMKGRDPKGTCSSFTKRWRVEDSGIPGEMELCGREHEEVQGRAVSKRTRVGESP